MNTYTKTGEGVSRRERLLRRERHGHQELRGAKEDIRSFAALKGRQEFRVSLRRYPALRNGLRQQCRGD
jgi:hypothetical protein